MVEESSEPVSESNSVRLSRRQLLGGAAGAAAISGVSGFFLGAYVGNPLWEDDPGGIAPRESSSRFSLLGTAAEPDFPGGINIYFDEDVIRWGGMYWADDVFRGTNYLPSRFQFNFINGGGYHARLRTFRDPTPANIAEGPEQAASLNAIAPRSTNYGDWNKAFIYLDLIMHTPEIEIDIPKERGPDFYGAEVWLDGLATNPRVSVGIRRPY